MHKCIQKLVFGGVSLATNFWSSLAPWPKAMVARSGDKNLRRFLAKFPTFECICVHHLCHILTKTLFFIKSELYA